MNELTLPTCKVGSIVVEVILNSDSGLLSSRIQASEDVKFIARQGSQTGQARNGKGNASALPYAESQHHTFQS